MSVSCAACGTAGLSQTLTVPPVCVLPPFRARTAVPVRCVVPTGARGGDRWCDHNCFQLSLQRA
eukprot:scaffold63015_cov82-Phaeocystis_antarctica.AAC.2